MLILHKPFVSLAVVLLIVLPQAFGVLVVSLTVVKNAMEHVFFINLLVHKYVLFEITSCRKTLITIHANERLLTCVLSGVSLHIAVLAEGFSTAFESTLEWPLLVVDPLVLL